DLILVEERFSRFEALRQRANPSKTALPAACGPRAFHEQLRPSPTGAESSQPPRHRRPAHPHLRVHTELARQQLTCPRRTGPTEVSRNTLEKSGQPTQQPFVELGFAVAATAVFQSQFAKVLVPCRHVAHGGADADAVSFDVDRTQPIGELEHDENSSLHQGVSLATAASFKSSSLTAGQLGYNPHGGTSFSRDFDNHRIKREVSPVNVL